MIRRDSPPLSSPPKSNAFLVLVTALTAVGLIACSANVRANQLTEEAQQLIRLTTVDNILRIDAEQAGFLMDQLPEELPAELRSQVRQAIDINPDYNKTQLALTSRLSSRLDHRRL